MKSNFSPYFLETQGINVHRFVSFFPSEILCSSARLIKFKSELGAFQNCAHTPTLPNYHLARKARSSPRIPLVNLYSQLIKHKKTASSVAPTNSRSFIPLVSFSALYFFPEAHYLWTIFSATARTNKPN